MSDLLTKALHDLHGKEGGVPSTGWYGYDCETLAAALRNHPDRLRIAASLLTVEDVARALQAAIVGVSTGITGPSEHTARTTFSHYQLTADAPDRILAALLAELDAL
jgi:hypothetical protein